MSDLADIANILSAAGSIVGAGITAYVAWIVHRYTIRKDKLDLLRFQWNEQQQINLMKLSNHDSIISWEKIVYGQDHSPSIEESKKYFEIFLILNRVHHMFIYYDNKQITKKEFTDEASETLRLLVREFDLVKYLVINRGYNPRFAEMIIAIMENLPPVPPRR